MRRKWDALLKHTEIELELLTDYNMHLFIEKGMRGGMSTEMKRYCKANNAYLSDYDPKEESSFILYLDANNLYGWAMSQPLPVGKFRWERKMPTEEQIMNLSPHRKKGFILEVDLEYPPELHNGKNPKEPKYPPNTHQSGCQPKNPNTHRVDVPLPTSPRYKSWS